MKTLRRFLEWVACFRRAAFLWWNGGEYVNVKEVHVILENGGSVVYLCDIRLIPGDSLRVTFNA